MTKAELKSQFQNSYKRDSWMPILKLVFGQINFFSNPFPLFEGEEAVKQGCQIGYVDLPNNQTVAIFEIEVADSIIIERNRKGLRDIAAKYIKGTFSAALVFYYSKNQTEYRFSFVAQQSKIDEHTGEFNTVVTAPKRYTYVLGTPFCATAAERWIKLAAEPEINVDKITDAFSVEKLSKEFFDQYKIQYTRFCKFIENDPVTLQQFIDHSETDAVKAQKPLRDYVKKLLGRLVFLQFLQKKGWMGVPATNKDWKGGDLNFMANLFNKSTYKDNYLDQVLEPLFFDTLNRERTNDIADKIDTEIKIPYLNGGLFERVNLDNTKVQFPKHYFSELFEFFNQYNFTIDENDPDDAEVGIDPEMLGHIFENLLEDNKDKGAFYTPKEIVRYMCQESLIAYLHTHTPEALHPSVEKLIRTHKVDDCLQDKPNATLIQKLLVAVKICDPAIGSGAFPMGMLYEIFMVRRLLFGFLGKNESFSACLVKKEIIQNNIYGVDIEQGAVDIARLRFWLALVVDEDVPQALPNLDYKIMCGNSLISRFALDAPIKDVFAEYNKKYKTNFTLQDYKNLVDEYTDVHNSKEQFRAKIEEIKGAFKSTLLNSDLVSRKKAEMEVLDYEMVDVFGERKADKDKKGYKTAKSKLEKFLKSEKDTLDNKLYINSFEWRFEFPSLLDDNGNFVGFDVVIGNPPYIGEKGNKDKFRNIKSSVLLKDYYQAKMDIFYFFFHLGINLSINNGIITYITTNYYPTADGAIKLRTSIKNQTCVIQLANFNEFKVFDSAIGQHNLITILKKGMASIPTKLISVNRKNQTGTDILRNILSGTDVETEYMFKNDLFEGDNNYIRIASSNCSEDSYSLFDKILDQSICLGNLLNINSGCDITISRITDKHLAAFPSNNFNKGDGVFVINEDELSALLPTLNQHEISLIKPYIKNSDISQFAYTKSKEYLIYIQWNENPEEIPNLIFHLMQFEDILKDQVIRYDEPSWPWYSIHRPREQSIFESTLKILVPYRCKINSFAICDESIYSSRDVFFITTIENNHVNLFAISSILNSKLMYYWLYNKGKRKGDTLELYNTPLSEIPISSNVANYYDVFERYTKRIIQLKYDSDEFKSLMLQINTLVYKLYELSYEEVLLIEPDFGQRLSAEQYEKIVVE